MHGTLPATPQRRSSSSRLPLLLRLAFRELRAGLKGFGIFLACIALGVAAIASVRPFGVDTSSGIQALGPREKDVGRMEQFMEAVRRADGCPPPPDR